MKAAHAWIIAIAILAGAALHPVLSLIVPTPAPAPLHVGYVQGEIHRREANGVAHLKCDGFRVEIYDTFILVFVDKSKEPTWTSDYVLTIPWHQVEHMTLMPPGEGG
ncbi:MAG: hypothetical protein ACYTG0_43240 [Planctomycetota bacterium]|jgi:hypothetical protein